MRICEHLQKLLVANCLNIVTGDKIILRGGDKRARYNINLVKVCHKMFIINLEKNPHSNLINQFGGYKKICDYFIMIPQHKKVLVLFCELKRTFQEKGGDQLHASIPFLDYLQSLIRIHFKQEIIFKHHYVILSHKISPRLDKQSTTPSPMREIGYEGIKIKVILGQSIPFNKMMP